MALNGGKVEICGVNTSELKVLGTKEKEELLKRAAKGDKKAREELISGNLKLVLSVIRRFTGRKTRTICFRSAVSVLSRQLIILICRTA